MCEYRLDREQSHLHATLRARQIKHGAAQSLLAVRLQSPTWEKASGIYMKYLQLRRYREFGQTAEQVLHKDEHSLCLGVICM